jgi:hypothetical protein
MHLHWGSHVEVWMSQTHHEKGFEQPACKLSNMGPNLRRRLSLLGTKRTACIILDYNSYSRNFKLDRGRAQGDNISPDTFNFGDQILIFRIELDPNIAGVWQNFQIPPLVSNGQGPEPVLDPHIIIENYNDFFFHESARETCKNESLADDNTTLMLTTTENFTILRQILDDFSMVSGLTCNYDKTNVLMIGPPVPNVNLAGFVPTDHIKLLGLKITKNLDSFDDTFSELHEKIRDLISFWDRFRLSLPGRISVIKNLSIPQLNYLACFLEPAPCILNEIQETLDSFALQGIQVAKDRRYRAPKNDGLGLFDLKPFLTALKCSWIKRAFSKNIDNWRYDLKMLAPDGELPLIHTFDVKKNEHLILYNFVAAFVDFRNALCEKG